MRWHTEVFVVGGGPAGLAAAIAARQQGLEVTVADGAQPPIDKACGEGLMPDTLAALAELGMVIQPKEGRSFRGIRFLEGNSVVQADFPHGAGLGLRRTVLHQKMVKRATACGVRLLWSTPVTGICDGGVVIDGKIVSARWIIGADGGRSRVRRWSGLDAGSRVERRFAFRRHYRAKPWSDYTDIYWGEGMQAYVTPLGKEETCVAVISGDPRVRLESAWKEFPRLAAELEGAATASTERGGITAMHRLARVHSGNVALIGDASGGVDAITGEGLCLSFRQARALGEALAVGNLSGYQEAHCRLSRRPRFMARLMLLLDGHPRLRQHALRTLAADPSLFERLVSVHVGVTSPAHFATTGALFGLGMLTA
jgi:flavin-dependent dehydrogenase